MTGPTGDRGRKKQDPLVELYEGLDREALGRQGQAYLAGNAVEQVRLLRRRLWHLAILAVVTGALVLGGFYLWILVEAARSGAEIADLRQTAVEAVLGEEGVEAEDP